jgi:hypothetical protein
MDPMRRFDSLRTKRMLNLLALALITAAAWAMGDASSARAQERQRAPKVIQLEEIQIEGRVQKPNAFYILNRSQLGYEVMDLRTSFVRDVVKAVEREPF